MLQTTIGSSPSSARACRTPPPVSMRRARSSEMMISMSRAALHVRFQQIGERVHVDDRALHACLHKAIEHVIDQRAARTCTSALGRSFVSGFMRVPRPAASTMAVVGSSCGLQVGWRRLRRSRCASASAGCFRVRARWPHSRGMNCAIRGLAVAREQAREDAEDAHGVDGAEHREFALELARFDAARSRYARMAASRAEAATSRRASCSSMAKSHARQPRMASWKSSKPTRASPSRSGSQIRFSA